MNIAEILKDCPKGTKLYSPLCGECTLYDVNDYNIRINTPNKDTLICLYHDGRYCSNGEIMLFPKGKTTWDGFVPPCKFKEGDRIVHKANKESPFTITEITDTSYKGGYRYEVLIEQQDNFELVPDKFDISLLKPFDKILVRTKGFQDTWIATFFSHKDDYEFTSFWTASGKNYQQCIPYNDDTKHLLGTTNDCDEYYKTW